MTARARRTYGEGGISPYSTKAGERFSIVYRALDPQTGSVRQFRRRGYLSRAQAGKALRDQLALVDRGTHVVRNKLTVAEWIESWITTEQTQVRASTHHSYARNLRLHVVPSLGSRRIQDLAPTEISALYSRLLEAGRRDHKVSTPLSVTSVRYVHVILRKCLEDAVAEGVLLQNPASRAKPPHARSANNRHESFKTWSEFELQKFLGATKEHYHNAAWTLLATTGLRRGEALGLRWTDVDLENGRLWVRRALADVLPPGIPVWSDPKTASGARTIELDAETIRVLRSHRKRQNELRLSLGAGYCDDHDLLFAQPDGQPLHPDRFSRSFISAVAKAGLPRIRLHDLRHTWATLALKAGVHPKVVQERLGHSSINTTLTIYSHVVQSMHTEAAEQVASLIFGARP